MQWRGVWVSVLSQKSIIQIQINVICTCNDPGVLWDLWDFSISNVLIALIYCTVCGSKLLDTYTHILYNMMYIVPQILIKLYFQTLILHLNIQFFYIYIWDNTFWIALNCYSSLLPFRSNEIKDVVSPSFKPRQYDSPFFIELAYPRHTAEQYLVSEQPTFI